MWFNAELTPAVLAGVHDDPEALAEFRFINGLAGAAEQLALGDIYKHGQSVPQADAEGARWLNLAAKQGQAFAKRTLGMYGNNPGVVGQDAARQIRRETKKRNAYAHHYLGRMYSAGNGVEQDDVEALRWCRLRSPAAWLFFRFDSAKMTQTSDIVQQGLDQR